MRSHIPALKAAILLLALLIIVSAGIAQAAPATLTVWMKKGFVDQQNTMFLERAKQFAQAQHVKVDVQFVAYEDFYPKWIAAIESNQVPDVSWFGYQEVGQFSHQGVLLDVTDVLRDIWHSYGAMYDTSVSAVTSGGKIWAAPFWTEGTALYYRKDLFEKAGLRPPTTWEEFRKAAAKLTDPQHGVYGAGIGFGRGDSDAEWLTRAMIWDYGGSLFGRDGRTPAADNKGTVEVMKLIRSIFLEDRSTPPSATNWDDSGNNTAYLTGQAAMVVNTGSIISALRRDNPDLLARTGVTLLPAGPAGRYVAGISNNLGIFKGAKNPALAKKFIKWVLDPKWYRKWIEVSVPLATPVYPALANDPIWQDPLNAPFVQSTKYFAFLGYPGPYTPEAGTVYNLRVVNDVFQKLIVNNLSPEQGAKALQEAIEAALRKGNK